MTFTPLKRRLSIYQISDQQNKIQADIKMNMIPGVPSHVPIPD